VKSRAPFALMLLARCRGPATQLTRAGEGRRLGPALRRQIARQLDGRQGPSDPHAGRGMVFITRTSAAATSVTRRHWEDYVLALDFKISKGCNSVVFHPHDALEPRPARRAWLFNVIGADQDSQGRFHDTGAIY